MAKSDEHRSAQERCRINAELAPNGEVRQAWLNLVDSYNLLLFIDKELDTKALIGRLPNGV